MRLAHRVQRGNAIDHRRPRQREGQPVSGAAQDRPRVSRAAPVEGESDDGVEDSRRGEAGSWTPRPVPLARPTDSADSPRITLNATPRDTGDAIDRLLVLVRRLVLVLLGLLTPYHWKITCAATFFAMGRACFLNSAICAAVQVLVGVLSSTTRFKVSTLPSRW